jgi:hypothetical protein
MTTRWTSGCLRRASLASNVHTATRIPVLFILSGVCVLAAAQDTSGSNTITDRLGANGPDAWCQATAPADWKTPAVREHVDASGRLPPAKAWISVVSGYGATFDQIKYQWTSEMAVPTHVFEDNPKRLWYESDPKGSPVENGRTYKRRWIVIIASKVVCVAQIAFNDPALEGQAKLVLNSLKPTK